MAFLEFITGSIRIILKGGRLYWAWITLLVALAAAAAVAYIYQLQHGLIVTGMRDQVSWGFYIGNFTFLVGVAAAAVVLVIPAYVYHWKPIKEIVIIGELLAISAITMCILFVTIDLGRPQAVWHLAPFVGRLHWPTSLLAWDVIVLSSYFALNFFIATYVLYCAFTRKHYNAKLLIPLVILSIPAAVSIHTVTAFIYNVLPSRPFWNASILVPRFLASAFCSGPAIMLIVFQILRRSTRFNITNDALQKIAELMSYAMFVNLLLVLAEVVKEYYSATEHLVHFEYYFQGLGGKNALVPFAWSAVITSIVAFIIFIVPKTRNNLVTMNIGCVMILLGVYIEKGMGLVIPGFIPTPLGEIFEYVPTTTETVITFGVWAFGALLFTLMTKVAIAIALGEFYARGSTPAPAAASPAH